MGKFKELYNVVEDGYVARMQNRPKSENPYPDDERKKYWEQGWVKADHELAKFNHSCSYANMEI